MAEAQAEEEPSYIDYETFLDPSFSATTFANSLVLATNNPSDTPLDLSTPLSRVLFDVQEIDTHIDSLTTKSALPLLNYTKDRSEAAEKILADVEAQVKSLSESYKILEREVVRRYEDAESVRLVAERLCETVRLGRAVSRCVMLGRQLEAQMSEVLGSGAGFARKGDHRAMVRCSNSLLNLRGLFYASKPGEEGHGLERVNAIRTLRSDLVVPSEENLVKRAQQMIREFSMSSLVSSTQAQGAAATFAQTEDTRSAATSALLTLYLLSPTKADTTLTTFEPRLLLTALQDYLTTALKSSLAALARSLATLPTLDRTLLEISARCQNIVALEALLETIKPPPHPLFSAPTDSEASKDQPPNFLAPLLAALDTSSLPSYFWRTLASNLSPEVAKILRAGGVSARTLKTNKDRVRDALRQCVDRGSQLPGGANMGKGKVAGWEREAAVMVGAVVGVLNR